MKKEPMTRKRTQKLGVNGLSTLEVDIMDIIWGEKKVTVRKVHETMLEDGYIPYTTVMAAMNNMAQKGLLKQNKDDKAFIYSAAISRDAMARTIVDTVVKRILDGNMIPILTHMLKLKADELENVLEIIDKKG